MGKNKKKREFVEENGMFHRFTDELIAEILLRLPGKSLSRSKCVCKRWKFLISEQSFVKSLVRRSNSLPPLNIGFFYRDYVTDEVNFFAFRNEIDYNIRDSSLSYLQHPVRIVDSHRGIVLCIQMDMPMNRYPYLFNYFVCNPVTKQWVALPEYNPWRQIYRALKDSLLLCYEKEEFHGQEIEYKVLFFIEDEDTVNVIEADTYSSETGEWAVSKIYHNLGVFSVSDHYILSDGTVYLWDDWGRRLCVYDLKEERISSVELPTSPNSRRILLGVSAGCLYYAETSFSQFRVWVLVDGVRWSLKHSYGYKSLIDEYLKTSDSGHFLCPFAFHPSNSNLVFARIRSPEYRMDVFVYDMDTSRIEVADNFYPRLDGVFPYALPASVPCLRNS